MASFTVDGACRLLEKIWKGLFGKLFTGLMKLLGLHDIQTAIIDAFNNFMSKVIARLRDFKTVGLLSSADGAVKIAEEGAASFNWEGLFDGKVVCALIIFLNACILIYEVWHGKITIGQFFKRLGVCIA